MYIAFCWGSAILTGSEKESMLPKLVQKPGWSWRMVKYKLCQTIYVSFTSWKIGMTSLPVNWKKRTRFVEFDCVCRFMVSILPFQVCTLHYSSGSEWATRTTSRSNASPGYTTSNSKQAWWDETGEQTFFLFNNNSSNSRHGYLISLGPGMTTFT